MDEEVDIHRPFNLDIESEAEASIHESDDDDFDEVFEAERTRPTEKETEKTDGDKSKDGKGTKESTPELEESVHRRLPRNRKRNRPGTFGKVPRKFADFYNSRATLADFYDLTEIEMDELLLENEDISDIAQEYEEKYYSPRKKVAESQGKEAGVRDGDIVKDIDTLLAADMWGDKTYSSPSKAEQRDWEPKQWLLRSLCRYRQELERHKILTPAKKVSEKNAYLWAYLLLKTQEVLHRSPSKKTKALNALEKARAAVTKRKRALDDRERASKAIYSSTVPITVQAQTSASAKKKRKRQVDPMSSPGNGSSGSPKPIEGSRSDPELAFRKTQEDKTANALTGTHGESRPIDKDMVDADIIATFKA